MIDTLYSLENIDANFDTYLRKSNKIPYFRSRHVKILHPCSLIQAFVGKLNCTKDKYFVYRKKK